MQIGRESRTRPAVPVCLLVLLYFICFGGTSLFADKQLDSQFPPATGTASKQVIEKYETKLKEIEQELIALKRPVPAEFLLADDGIACLLDSPYFAQIRSGQKQYRFLVGRLVIINRTDTPLELKTEDVHLHLNGKEYRPGERTELTRFANFRMGERHYSISDLKPAQAIKVPAGQIASSWVVFHGLPAGNDVPHLVLRWKFNNLALALDASLQHRALLRWRRREIGPKGIISLCTIAGEINTINLGTIVDDFVTLATQNMTRVIIQFGDQAPEIDPHLMQWLQRIASQAGREKTQNAYLTSEFPLVPAMIREIHLAKIPSGTTRTYSSSSGPSRVHENLNDAIIAISQSVYESISIADLLRELKNGDPLTKPAVLIHGAPRFPQEVLPDIISISKQNDQPLLQNAALICLGEFNDPRAVALLEMAAQSKNESVSLTALASLGTSRFPAHQKKIMELLVRNETAASSSGRTAEFQQRVIRVLAQFPRRRWAEALYKQARSKPITLQVEAIKALNEVGHPRLHDLLISLLQSEESELQKASLEILAQRTDRDSIEAVKNYALQQLEKGTPDEQTFQVVALHKIQKAIPVLLKLLESDEKQRSSIINTLAAIGDEKILDAFIDIYPELDNSTDRLAILQALRKIDQDRFLEFAPAALDTKDLKIIAVVSSFLRETASEEAVDIFIKVIRSCPDDDPRLTHLITVLGYLSTPESQKFLVALRDSKSELASRSARSALQNLYQRSPVHYLSSQASNTARGRNYPLAIKQFTLAIEGDPGYPMAYEGRAIVYQVLQQYENALADFKRLVEIDPHWPKVHGRMGKVLSSLSRFDESVESLTLAIEQEPEDSYWYSSRGHAYSMLESFEKAEQDYKKALKLNPKNMTALTGVSLSLAINGKIDEAIAQIQSVQAEYKKDSIFAYNAACTYSRAAEYLQKHSTGKPEQKKRIDQLIEKSLDELERSISLGYKDVKWTRTDPDLEMLREHERFEKLLIEMTRKNSG